jgi:hypothetical protein
MPPGAKRNRWSPHTSTRARVSQTVGDDQKKRPALSMTEHSNCWPDAVYPTEPGGPQICPGTTPLGAGTALMVVGVGAGVPTFVGADEVGLTVVGGGVVVVVGTSLAGTVTTDVTTDVEVVGASGVAGRSTGAAVVRVVGTRTIGVALAAVAVAVGAGTVSAVVVVAVVVVVVVDWAVTVVANTTTVGTGALVATTVDDDVVGIAAALGRE